MLEKKVVSQCVSADYCRGWNDAVEAIPRWIPVEERLPEELTDVLTKCGHGAAWFYGLAHLFEGKWKVDGIGGSVDIVTHWMPLPEPPEEVEK